VATTPASQMNTAEFWSKNKNVVVPMLIIGAILIIAIPLPSPVLDVLIAINLSFAFVLLLLSMYVKSPADFSIFPSLLLILTLYRLSLNVASTRLILANGGVQGEQAAGRIIESFGSIVIAGNYVIGTIIFLLIIIIQYVVITQGAVRIGEVSARFTLDALPGKQMAIDADLNAGFIDEIEARKRRERITQEAAFFGSMDGASRFTRRDSMASLIITIINIVGGLIIGTTTYSMSLAEAATIFTTLTVGDGLVSAIPSLVIAVAGGLMVTRGSSKDDLGAEVTSQVIFDYRPLAIASAMMFIFAIFLEPSRFVFIVLGVALASIAYARYKAETEEKVVEEQEREEKERLPPAPERVENLLQLDPLGLEVGYNLIPMVDVSQGGNILDRIKGIRRQLALELGIIVPPIRIRDNLQLEPNQYQILLRGVEIAKAELMINHLLAMSPGQAKEQIEGITTRDPAFGLPAIWIPEDQKERAQINGYTVVDTATVISTHLTETIKSNAYRLLGIQETQGLIDLVSDHSPKLVEELVPNVVGISVLQKVLQNLLRERVSIRDLQSILETLGDYASYTKDAMQLTEFVRMTMGQAIVQPYLAKNNELTVITLNPALENEMANNIQRSDAGQYLAMPPNQVQQLLQKLRNTIETSVFPVQPIVLVSAEVRPHLAQLTEKFLSGLIVLSHNEIPSNVSVTNLGVVE